MKGAIPIFFAKRGIIYIVCLEIFYELFGDAADGGRTGTVGLVENHVVELGNHDDVVVARDTGSVEGDAERRVVERAEGDRAGPSRS